MRTHNRLIGVLGGMGPFATIDFMSKIVAATPANVDQDHVPLIVHDVPQIPDRSAAIQNGNDAPFLPMLAGVRLLDAAGVEFIAIPCNTAHFWYPRLARGCRARIIHIADAVYEHIETVESNPRCLGIMATRGTVSAGIYTERFIGENRRWLIPSEDTQLLVDQAISAIKRGQFHIGATAAEKAVRQLAQAGAESILLACTELPVALPKIDRVGIPLIDATQVLAEACVTASLGHTDFAMAG